MTSVNHLLKWLWSNLKYVMLLSMLSTLVLYCAYNMFIARSIYVYKEYLAHNTIVVSVERDPLFDDGRAYVAGFGSNDQLQFASWFLCSEEFLRQEFEKTRDINTYALLYEMTHNGVLGTDNLLKVLVSGEARTCPDMNSDAESE